MTGIKDVAREVEMSTATVSRALRGLPGVSDATRERVREAAQRLGYVPSPSAAGLASGQTRTVAVVVPLVTRWFFASVVQGAEEVLRERGYDLLLYNLAGVGRGPAPGLRDQPADQAGRRRAGAQPEAQRRRARPARGASTGRSPSSAPTCPGWATVRIDDERAARTATEHLLGLGHRRIAYVGGRRASRLHRAQRPRGGLPRHARRGRAAARPRLEVDGGFTIAGGIDAGRPLLSRPDRPTAIFAASDEMAIGVLRAARELRPAGPRGRVGHRDRRPRARRLLRPDHGRPAGARAGPGRGAAGARRPGRRRRGGWHPDQVILPTTLLQRGSTGPPPPG